MMRRRAQHMIDVMPAAALRQGGGQQVTHLWVMWAGRRGATVSSRPVMVASSLLTQPM